MTTNTTTTSSVGLDRLDIESGRLWWARGYTYPLTHIAIFRGSSMIFKVDDQEIVDFGVQGRLQVHELEEGMEIERGFRSIEDLLNALSECVQPLA